MGDVTKGRCRKCGCEFEINLNARGARPKNCLEHRGKTSGVKNSPESEARALARARENTAMKARQLVATEEFDLLRLAGAMKHNLEPAVACALMGINLGERDPAELARVATERYGHLDTSAIGRLVINTRLVELGTATLPPTGLAFAISAIARSLESLEAASKQDNVDLINLEVTDTDGKPLRLVGG